ncbi:MAG TPA: DUF2071 domain-containing protein [Flavobacterium sp.]|nr:DUF2071 domain-containing protein [Flavobacterium sp.]
MKIQDLIRNVSHRPWEFPKNIWKYYQEWNDALFLHWEVPYESLQELVPREFILDSFEGKYYVSIVAFKMQNIRPRNLPPLSLISNFYEINVRTYIKVGDKQGVYFLNIEAGNSLAAFLCRKLSGLPYEKSEINRAEKLYSSNNYLKNFSLYAKFEILESEYVKKALDSWLTERYCLYLTSNNQFFRYEVHHQEWEIEPIQIEELKVNYKIGKLVLKPDNLILAHYSKGVNVLAWNKGKIDH